MIPVVLEQHGRTAPRAQALFQRLFHHRTQTFVGQGLAAYSSRAYCSEQPGSPLLSVNLLQQRPGRRTVHKQPGWTPPRSIYVRGPMGPGPPLKTPQRRILGPGPMGPGPFLSRCHPRGRHLHEGRVLVEG